MSTLSKGVGNFTCGMVGRFVGLVVKTGWRELVFVMFDTPELVVLGLVVVLAAVGMVVGHVGELVVFVLFDEPPLIGPGNVDVVEISQGGRP